MGDIFIETLIKTTLIMPLESVLKNIDESVLNRLKETYEGKCMKDGYIMEDSIVIVKRSMAEMYGSQMNGKVKFTIQYKAKICSPMKDNIIKCTINSVNKLGVLAFNKPLRIIIAKEFHKKNDVFKNLKQGDEIEIKIIDKKFDLNSTNIQVIAMLNNVEEVNVDLKNEKTSSISSTKDKNNKKTLLDDDGVDTSEDGGDTSDDGVDTSEDGGDTSDDGGDTSEDGGVDTSEDDGGNTSDDGGDTSDDEGDTSDDEEDIPVKELSDDSSPDISSSDDSDSSDEEI